ncbi:hyaluronidase [Nilaparvata lugens]|uniref:hyaluronidase n=1 Tax=Nilaparvata lugens TaxID=108931 RepID=UPI00193DC44B|nr:hyaluronidase [Nilaparvata lugens]
MVKVECFLPYLIMLVILMFLIYDIITILNRETFKVVLVDKESGCSSFIPDGMELNAENADNESGYIRFLLNQGLFPNYPPVGEEINGGLPQTGNLTLHLEKFKNDVEGHKWQNYTGIISVILSYWHHNWDLNDAAYQEKSINLSAKINGQLNDLSMTEQIKQKAQEMFESAAKNFLLNTLKEGKALIPDAKWGLAGTPVCTNCASCTSDNSGSDWLFTTSEVAFIEVNLHNGGKIEKIAKCIESNSKIKSKHKIKVFLTTKLTYHESGDLIDENDLSKIFSQTKNLGYDGIIITIINNPRNDQFCDALKKRFDDSLEKQIKELTNDWFL